METEEEVQQKKNRWWKLANNSDAIGLRLDMYIYGLSEITTGTFHNMKCQEEGCEYEDTITFNENGTFSVDDGESGTITTDSIRRVIRIVMAKYLLHRCHIWD